MKVILDLCAGTGAWSQPYVDNGYYVVHRITLPDYDVTDVVITNAHIKFRGQREGVPPLVVRITDIHGILAAPPCTVFSLANTRSTYLMRPDWASGLVAVRACEDIIRACMVKGYLAFWALENPFGHLRKFLGVPRLTFEAWWYDADCAWVKKTDLWGYYKQPRRVVADEDRPAKHTNAGRDKHRHTEGWYKPDVPERYAHMALDRAAIRAITPDGFAQAFFKANR